MTARDDIAPGRQMVFRGTSQPSRLLPLAVRSAGLHKVGPDYTEDRPPRSFWQVFWIVQGRLVFTHPGGATRAEPGDLFTYYPLEAHQICMDGVDTCYAWATLDGPETGQWLKASGIGRILVSAGPAPVALFRALMDALRELTPEGERRASTVAYDILTRAACPTPQAERHRAARARAFLDKRFAEVACCVEALASEEGVHRSTLYRSFMEAFGESPQSYLQRRRIQAGLSLMQSTDWPIQEIALRCGIPDANYFARLIRKTTGMSPRELRR